MGRQGKDGEGRDRPSHFLVASATYERLPSSMRWKDRCSSISDPIQWLRATCGWVFLEVVSSLME